MYSCVPPSAIRLFPFYSCVPPSAAGFFPVYSCVPPSAVGFFPVYLCVPPSAVGFVPIYPCVQPSVLRLLPIYSCVPPSEPSAERLFPIYSCVVPSAVRLFPIYSCVPPSAVGFFLVYSCMPSAVRLFPIYSCIVQSMPNPNASKQHNVHVNIPTRKIIELQSGRNQVSRASHLAGGRQQSQRNTIQDRLQTQWPRRQAGGGPRTIYARTTCAAGLSVTKNVSPRPLAMVPPHSFNEPFGRLPLPDT